MCAIDPEQTQSKQLINIFKIKILQFFVHNDISNEYHRAKFVLSLSLFFQAFFFKQTLSDGIKTSQFKKKQRQEWWIPLRYFLSWLISSHSLYRSSCRSSPAMSLSWAYSWLYTLSLGVLWRKKKIMQWQKKVCLPSISVHQVHHPFQN